MNIRLTHIDGKLPNLALMAISSIHRHRGDEIYFTRDVERGLFEGKYDRVYGSCIFEFSRHRLHRFLRAFPDAVVGGTGVPEPTLLGIGSAASSRTVESIIGEPSGLDYSLYPHFTSSIGFTQRGCRLSCKFCVVPSKEGRNRATSSIAEIWRGAGHPKRIHLLDNDFFGQPREQWRARIREIREGGFRVCLNQGVNIRLIDDEAAEALASIEYRDDQFRRRMLYTAWDNLRDERIFFAGIERLERAGIPAKHVMAYMLIGYDPCEDWERIWRRFNSMVERDIRPYPMVYDRSRKDLLCFQRWVITGLYRFVPWDKYRRRTKSKESLEAWHKIRRIGTRMQCNIAETIPPMSEVNDTVEHRFSSSHDEQTEHQEFPVYGPTPNSILPDSEVVERIDPPDYIVHPSRLACPNWNDRKAHPGGDIYSSYSGDTICDTNRVRQPFEWQGSLWVAVSMDGMGGFGKAKAYRLVFKRSFDGTPTTYREKTGQDHGEAARNDPMGFYHGMTVTQGRETYVLCGPPAIFAAGTSDTQSSDLQHSQPEQLSLF